MVIWFIHDSGMRVAWLRESIGAVAKASLHRAIVTTYGPIIGIPPIVPFTIYEKKKKKVTHKVVPKLEHVQHENELSLNI